MAEKAKAKPPMMQAYADLSRAELKLLHNGLKKDGVCPVSCGEGQMSMKLITNNHSV
jgi:hypothetical protein